MEGADAVNRCGGKVVDEVLSECLQGEPAAQRLFKNSHSCPCSALAPLPLPRAQARAAARAAGAGCRLGVAEETEAGRLAGGQRSERLRRSSSSSTPASTRCCPGRLALRAGRRGPAAWRRWRR